MGFERRAKQSPLRDVAEAGRKNLEPRRKFWHSLVCSAYLDGYYTAGGDAPFLPNEAVRGRLLEIYMIEKALYELKYELNNRPDWVHVPLSGILEILEADRDANPRTI